MAGKVEKTYLFFSDFDQGNPYLIDTIQIDGVWWLVGSWIVPHGAEGRTPEIIVRLTGLRFDEVFDPRYRFLLQNSIPKAALEGQAQDGLVVARYPALAHIRAPNATRH